VTPIEHVEVVIPARDEEQRIGGCVAAVRRAAQVLTHGRADISCGITVVLDCCTDDTEHRIANGDVRILTSTYGCVGGARKLGAADALRRTAQAGVLLPGVWLACTDADSVVPPDWLTVQIGFADDGIDAVMGTVTPSDLGPDVFRMWCADYHQVEGHQHVHGANLGIRASTYCSAGGFTATEVDEDVDLVRRVRAVTDRWIATPRISVLTSGRSWSHVDGGFATYVDNLTNEAS